MKDILIEIDSIFKDFHIKNAEDYLKKSAEDFSEIYENMKVVQEYYYLSDAEMEEALESILGEFEE